MIEGESNLADIFSDLEREEFMREHLLAAIARQRRYFEEQIERILQQFNHARIIYPNPHEDQEEVLKENSADLIDDLIAQALILSQTLIALKRRMGLADYGERHLLDGEDEAITEVPPPIDRPEDDYPGISLF